MSIPERCMWWAMRLAAWLFERSNGPVGTTESVSIRNGRGIQIDIWRVR